MDDAAAARGEQDIASIGPRAAASLLDVGNGLGQAAGDRHREHLAAAEEADQKAVGRPEWIVCVAGSGDRSRFTGRKRPHVQAATRRALRDECHHGTVWRDNRRAGVGLNDEFRARGRTDLQPQAFNDRRPASAAHPQRREHRSGDEADDRDSPRHDRPTAGGYRDRVTTGSHTAHATRADVLRRGFERDARLADVAQPPFRIPFETACNHLAHTRRQVRRESADVDGTGQHCHDDVRDALSREEAPPGEHLHRTTPKAQMSARRSTWRPRACSGDM